MKHYANLCENYGKGQYSTIITDSRLTFCKNNCLDRTSCQAYVDNFEAQQREREMQLNHELLQ